MGKSEIAVYEWRHTAGAEHPSPDYWRDWCKFWGKAWTFQLERGDTGYHHFQGVISMKVRRTVASTKKAIQDANWELPMHFAPASNNVVKAGTEAFYSSKPDTREAGPWTDKDVETIEHVPYQYAGLIDRLMPWQRKVWESAEKEHRDSRHVDVVIDSTGNRGKSTIASLMELYNRGYDMPTSDDPERLVASVCNILTAAQDRDPKVICFDLTRSQKQDALHSLYNAIEQIKKGKVVDLRYKYQKWWFDSPRVWVFCNEAPYHSYLSPDRWRMWSIDRKNRLIPRDKHTAAFVSQRRAEGPGKTLLGHMTNIFLK